MYIFYTIFFHTFADTDPFIYSGYRPFYGIFDGGRHVVTVNINSNSYYVGVFGVVMGATISNLGVKGNIVGTSNGRVHIGGVCGAVYGAAAITNCYNAANISSASSSPKAGGICGYGTSQTKIANCLAANATITFTAGTGEALSGRILGRKGSATTIENSYAAASMTINGQPTSSQQANDKQGKDLSGSIASFMTEVIDLQVLTGTLHFTPGNSGVSLASSNPAVTEVTNGLSLTSKQAGDFTLSVLIEGNSIFTALNTKVLTVSGPVTGVSLNIRDTTLYASATATLTATVLPPGASNKAVSWSSSNTEVASISYNGLSCTVKAESAGEAWIKVETAEGGFADSCLVRVKFDDLTWSFDSTTGTLTVSGEGNMANYQFNWDTYLGTAPWQQYRENIRSIVIEESVTSIGTWAFTACSNLTSVTFPSQGLTHIWYGAFNECINLPSIIFPVGSRSRYP
jgi:hypothetical protein